MAEMMDGVHGQSEVFYISTFHNSAHNSYSYFENCIFLKKKHDLAILFLCICIFDASSLPTGKKSSTPFALAPESFTDKT